MLLKNAQILSERPNAINDIRLRLDDPDAAPRVARQAEAELGYKAVPWQEANESLLEALVVLHDPQAPRRDLIGDAMVQENDAIVVQCVSYQRRGHGPLVRCFRR